MRSRSRARKPIRRLPFAAAVLGLLVALCAPTASLAHGDPIVLSLVRDLGTNDIGVVNPAGLASFPEAGLLYVLQAHSTTRATVIAMTPNEERVASVGVDVVEMDPINMTFDAAFRRLLLLDSAADELVALAVAPDGALSAAPEAVVRYDLAPLRLQRPRGLAVDALGTVLVLDGDGARLVYVTPDATGDLDAARAVASSRVSRLDLPMGLMASGGLVVNPRNALTYVLSAADSSVHVLDAAGRYVARLRLPPAPWIDPQGLAFAASSDLTDDPSVISLYVADTGLPADWPTGQEVGHIIELSLPVVHVPGDAPTIQAGIDLAHDGDVVLIAPGTYHENLHLADKAVTLASHYVTTGDAAVIESTVIDGGGDTVLTVASSAGPETRVIGLTIQNGHDGISASAPMHVYYSRFIRNKDGIDYEAGGGFCRWNVFDGNKDDAIDLDGPTAAVMEDNVIRNSRDDGIEIRLHRYAGPPLEIVIRRNIIVDSGEDGIQLIDYPDTSDRVLYIERNLILRSAQVGLGLMDDGVTTEDMRGASIPERIYLINNTFVGNAYGVTGGDNLIALNNILADTTHTALQHVDGASIAAYNLFWGNGADWVNATVDTAGSILADPRLDADGRPLPGSPAIDAGTSVFDWGTERVLDLASDAYWGTAPDVGAFEAYHVFLPVGPNTTGDRYDPQ